MGGSTHVTSQKYDGVIVQSSLKGIPITKGWGTTKTGCNLIDYLDFSSKKVSTGKGGGAQPDYDYYATLLLAIGLGPIPGVRTIYKDSAYYIAQGSGSKEVNGTTITISAKSPAQAAGLSQIFLGSIWQAPWSYLSTSRQAHALGYSGIAYAAAENYSLNTSATVPNFNFEVQWPVQGTISGVVQDDANPADILDDLLPDVPRWPTGAIASLSTYQTYCYAQGLLLSPEADGGRQASDLITEVLACSNSDCFVSEGLFQVVPLGDTPITANGVTYTPDLTPIYSLTYDDIIPSSAGEDPVQWDIKPADQCYNYVTVGFLDRTQQYASDSVPAIDQAALNQFGRNQADPVTYESICLLSVATTVAQLMVQKSANLRRTAKLVVPETFGLLDPMDLIEVPAPGGAATLVRINSANEQQDGSIELDVEEMLVGTSHAPLYTRQSGLGVASNFAVDPGDSTAPTIINPPMSLTGGQNEVWLATAGGPDWGGAVVWVSLDGEDFYQQATVTQPGRFGVTTTDFPAGSDPDTSDTLGVNLAASGGELTTAVQADADAQTTLCAVGTEIIAYSAATLTGANAYSLGTYIRRGLEGTTIADQPSGSLFMRLDNAVCTIPYNAGQVGKTLYVKLQSFNLYGNGFQDLDLCETYEFTAEQNGSQVGDVSVTWSTLEGIPAAVTNYVNSGGTAVNTANVGSQTAAQVNTALASLNPFTDTSTPNTPTGLNVSTATSLDAAGNVVATLTATCSAATDANIAGYEFALSINGGAAQVGPNTQPTFTWSVPLGQPYSVQVREVKASGVRGAYCTAYTGTTAVDTTAPSAPTGVTATGGYGSIFVSWTNPSASDLDHIEIWAGPSSSTSASTQVGTVVAAPSLVGSFPYSTGTSAATVYFFVRAVDTSGNKSGFTTAVSAAPAAVPASSLSGQLSASQIASVAAATVIGQITASQIGSVSASTVTGQLAASQIGSVYASALSGTVQANQIAAIPTTQLSGYISTGQFQANSISGNILIGQSVAANAIVSNSLTSVQIAANGITAVSLALTGDNLIRDPYFNAPTTAWQTATVYNNSTSTTETNTGWYLSTYGISPNNGWYINAPSDNADLGATSGITIYQAQTNTYGYNNIRYLQYGYWNGTVAGFQVACSPISGNVVYELGAQMENAGTGDTLNFQIDIYDAQGNYLSSSPYVACPTGSHGFLTSQFTSPANAAWARPQVNNSGGSNWPSGSYMRIGALSLRQANAATMIVDGSITSVKINVADLLANNIVAQITSTNSLNANVLVSGSITTSNFTSNTISGAIIQTGSLNASAITSYSITTTQLAANSVTAANISVSSLSAINANLGSITGGSLNINGLFIVNSSGAVTIQSATSGQRLVMSNSLIQVYNGSGTLQCQFGIF